MTGERHAQPHRLIVTRPAGQAAQLVAELKRCLQSRTRADQSENNHSAVQNASCVQNPTSVQNHSVPVIQLPLLAIEARAFQFPAGRFERAIFTSPNAVDFALANEPTNRLAQIAQIWAIGSKSREHLKRFCEREIHCPEQMNSEGLLALAQFQSVKDEQILLVKGEGGRELLAEELTLRGAKVTCLDVYRRLPLPKFPSDQSFSQQNDWWLLSSSEALAVLAQLQPAAKVLVSSDRLAAEALKLGLTVIATGAGASDQHWLQLVQKILG